MEVCEREAPLLRETVSPVQITGEVLRGYAVVYGQRSQLIHEKGRTFYEVIDRGAFTESMKSRNVTFVFRHNDDAEYGDTKSGTLKLAEDDVGIHFEMPLPPYANSLREKIKTGVVRGMSFSFLPRDLYRDNEGVVHVRKGELLHVSPVYNPAYPQTTVALNDGRPAAQKLKLKLLIAQNV